MGSKLLLAFTSSGRILHYKITLRPFGLSFTLMQADLPYMLPEAALSSITSLLHLTLRFRRKDSLRCELKFPLARATPHLTYLNLSENSYGGIPIAARGLEMLQCLDLSNNPLRLRMRCLETVETIPKLRTLDLRKEKMRKEQSSLSQRHGWDSRSMKLMKSFCEKLPELDVLVD